MSESKNVSRRQFVGTTLAAVAAAGVAKRNVLAATGEDAKKDAEFNGMPCGYLGKAKISRLMLGGNLIGGYMHCRDLNYVNQLFRAYATEEKIIETLAIAEENGVNTVFETGANFVERYNRKHNGCMQIIPHIAVGASPDKIEDEVKRNIDCGAVAHYAWGAHSDVLVRAGEIGRLKRAIEIAKEYDLPVGVGCHSLQVPIACEENDVPCDFYVKTLHTDDYFSATPKELQKDFMWSGGAPGWHDNMWCIDVDKVIEFFASQEKPWVAFKVLAAGAIPPRKGLTHAFENGADFVPLGMFDFQIKEDCDLAKRIIRRAGPRPRPWCA